MIIEDLTERIGEWLRGSGPESDIVMSSRIRLARNVADFPFIRRCSDIDRANLESTIRESMKRHPRLAELDYVNVALLEQIDRQFLVERQLISRELSDAEGARSVAIEKEERLSVMINEEDHLRIQVMHSGFDLQNAWERINELDDMIESQIRYAYHQQYGYLTACPTNVGTGMRVSVLVHLPALVITQQI
ncbi:MAG: ATP--guanido phosphotransferase, partial [Planctomycetota bacterium]